MSAINNAIKDSGLTQNTGNQIASVNNSNLKINAGEIRKSVKDPDHKLGESSDNNNSNGDSGEYAQSTGGPRAQSTVSKHLQKGKLTNQSGTLTDPDKQQKIDQNRGEGHEAPTDGLGLNSPYLKDHQGIANLPPGAALAPLSGLLGGLGGAGLPPMDLSKAGSGSGGGGSISPPKASTPQRKINQGNERPKAEEHPKFSEDQKAVESKPKEAPLTDAEKNKISKYEDTAKFLESYVNNEEFLGKAKEETAYANMPKNFKENYNEAKASGDKELASKMEKVHSEASEAFLRAGYIGKKQADPGDKPNDWINKGFQSKDFLLGSENNKPGLQDLKTARDDLNKYLKDNGYLDKDAKQITSETLLNSPDALKDTEKSEIPPVPEDSMVAFNSTRSDDSMASTRSLDLEINDAEDITEMKFKDDLDLSIEVDNSFEIEEDFELDEDFDL